MRIVAYARGSTRLAQHHRKLGFDVLSMKRERSLEAREVGIAERLAQARAFRRVVGQLLRLAIVAILETMLDVAQKAVGALQSVTRALRQQTAFGECGERSPRVAHTKVGLLSPTHDLQRLRDEFDFTNTAASELDVVRVAASALLFAYLAVNIAQTFVHVVIEILAINERRDVARELVVAVAGQWPCLEPCVAFPRPSLCNKVMLERDERRGQRTAFPIGTKAHVDAEDVTVGGDFIESADHAASEPIEEFTVGDGPGTARIPFLRIDEHEIDIGRDVELAAAQLPHADDDQLLRCAAFRADGIAQRGGKLRWVGPYAGGNANSPKVRNGVEHLAQSSAPGQVA